MSLKPPFLLYKANYFLKFVNPSSRKRFKYKNPPSAILQKITGKMPTSSPSSYPTPATIWPEMEPRIWSQLPEHLLDYILALLPLKTLISLRSTSKHFNSLILSPSFLALPRSRFSSSPSFLLVTHPQFPNRTFSLFDPILGCWRMLALSFPISSPCKQLNLISSCNGLLCFSTSNSFLVANLLTKSSKIISFPRHPFTIATLISLNSNKSHHQGYKLCLLSVPSNSPSSVFLYDSSTNSWRKFNGFDQILRLDSHREGAYSNGCLYFIMGEPFSVASLDLETGKWKISLGELPSDLIFARLVSGEAGKLFLIGGVGRDGLSRSLNIWELGEDGKDWVALGTLPELMCRKFFSACFHHYEYVYCMRHESWICVYAHTWPEILVYEVGRGKWHWLPKCPLLPEKPTCGFKWFSFLPNLYAIV